MPHPLAFASESSNTYAWILRQWGTAHVGVNIAYGENTELLSGPAFKHE